MTVTESLLRSLSWHWNRIPYGTRWIALIFWLCWLSVVLGLLLIVAPLEAIGALSAARSRHQAPAPRYTLVTAPTPPAPVQRPQPCRYCGNRPGRCEHCGAPR